MQTKGGTPCHVVSPVVLAVAVVACTGWGAGMVNIQGYVSRSGSHEDLLHAVDAVLHGETAGPNANASRYADLTMRELEMLDLVKRNKTCRQIADTLFISRRTVETHVASIFRKTGTSRRSERMSL